MNLGEIIFEYIGEAAVSAVSLFAGWYFAKRRDTAETKVIEADAVANMQAVYDKFVADMKARNEEIVRELEGLTEEVKELRTTVKTLEQDLEDCRKGISKMNKKVA